MPLILAPGGSEDAVTAAIANGADGLYLGGRGWSRWGRTTELTAVEITACINMARHADKEVQVVFNRVPAHGETSTFLQAVESYCRQGADEVILNDLGAIALVRRHLPAVKVGTSIGCSLKNLEDAKFYADLGVSTLVLPWTMGPAEIRALKQYCPGLRLEVFLYVRARHMVLGNCSLGSYVHQKQTRNLSGTLQWSGSAKRCGNCSQPCTATWEFTGAGDLRSRGPLRQRNLVILTPLAAMIEAGVDLLKIQGRNFDATQTGRLVRTLKGLVTGIRTGSTPSRTTGLNGRANQHDVANPTDGSPASLDPVELDPAESYPAGLDAAEFEFLTELLPQLEFM